MGPSPSKSGKLDRSVSIKAPHPTRTNERVRYGASLSIKSKGRGRKKFLLQKVSENGIAHLAGLRNEDEIISINERKLDGNDTAESIVNDIEKDNYILLELKRKTENEKEPIPFIVFFNLTVEECGEVIIHQFGFYWRTPLNEWKEILNPLIQRVITGDGGRGDCAQSLSVIQNRRLPQFSTKTTTSWNFHGNPTRVQISLNGNYLAVDSDGQNLILENSPRGTNTQFWQYLYVPSSRPEPGKVPVIFVPVDVKDFRIVAVNRQLALGGDVAIKTLSLQHANKETVIVSRSNKHCNSKRKQKQKFEFSHTITEVDELFFLMIEGTSTSFTVKHEGALGTFYWNLIRQTLTLTNLEKEADCFKIQ